MDELIGFTITSFALIGSILLALPGVTPFVAVVAAMYILWLAFRIATAPPLIGTGNRDSRPSFRTGLFLSLINPKGYAAMAALYFGFVLVKNNLLPDAAAKLAVITATMVVVNFAWLLSGAALTQAFRNPKINPVINLAFAALLVVSVVLALWI